MIPIIAIDDTAAQTGVAASGLKSPPPVTLYIHIPWCVKKCPYCDFNSHPSRGEIPETAYVDALIADLEQAVPKVWGRKIQSVFFGGGTPSLFSPAAIERILNQVRMLTPLEYEAEITLEANPGTVDAAHFAGYRETGVNRLSLGIQSFDDRYLARIGRIHNAGQAQAAAELALATFENVNLDLMYALPQQSLADALADAKRACELAPAHLSFYHLTLEPNTPFHRNPPSLPDDDSSAAMQQAIEERLAAGGYAHYETSAFAQSGRHARHNVNYWTFGDYLGIGAGAHSKLSYRDKITREARHKHPKRYMEQALRGQAIDRAWDIDRSELGVEFMMNALRLTAGFDLGLYTQRTGLPVSTIAPALKTASDKKLIEMDAGLVRPTLLGQRFLNELLQLFMH